LGFAFGDGMQVAAVALIGRSLGERKAYKAVLYGNICQKVGLFISACLAVLLFFGGRTIFGFFFSEPNVLDMGVLISRYIMIIVLFQISQVIFGGCLRGAGDARYCLIASLISVTIIRSVVTWGLTGGILSLGLHGIWIGILSDQVSRFTFLSTRFKKGDWVNYEI
ncbi:MAG: MATE family efflux transporter, partial [Erysipelotrichaceae bacterium]|nr:MATE family efflux transporter [Erysipelotrichaceae bacterium]